MHVIPFRSLKVFPLHWKPACLSCNEFWRWVKASTSLTLWFWLPPSVLLTYNGGLAAASQTSALRAATQPRQEELDRLLQKLILDGGTFQCKLRLPGWRNNINQINFSPATCVSTAACNLHSVFSSIETCRATLREKHCGATSFDIDATSRDEGSICVFLWENNLNDTQWQAFIQSHDKTWQVLVFFACAKITIMLVNFSNNTNKKKTKKKKTMTFHLYSNF